MFSREKTTNFIIVSGILTLFIVVGFIGYGVYSFSQGKIPADNAATSGSSNTTAFTDDSTQSASGLTSYPQGDPNAPIDPSQIGGGSIPTDQSPVVTSGTDNTTPQDTSSSSPTTPTN